MKKKQNDKQMKCRLMIRGGKMSRRRPESAPHLFFDRMVTVEQVGNIVAYLAQFDED